jgi:hypothetical protein
MHEELKLLRTEIIKHGYYPAWEAKLVLYKSPGGHNFR